MSWFGIPLRSPGKLIFGTFLALVLLTPSASSQQSSTGLLTAFVSQSNQGDRLVYDAARDWFIKCSTSNEGKNRRCELETDLSNTDNERVVDFSIQIIVTGKKTPPLAIVRTPLDLHLAKGVELRVGKGLVGKLTYRSCHSTGCVVPFSMVGQVSRRFLRGNRARFVFFDLKGKKQQLELSLLGISSALKRARNFF